MQPLTMSGVTLLVAGFELSFCSVFDGEYWRVAVPRGSTRQSASIPALQHVWYFWSIFTIVFTIPTNWRTGACGREAPIWSIAYPGWVREPSVLIDHASKWNTPARIESLGTSLFRSIRELDIKQKPISPKRRDFRRKGSVCR